MPNGWEWCRLGDLGEYKKGPFGSSLTKSMFVPFSQSAIKIYEQKNAIKKDYSLGEYYISKEKFKDMSAFQVLPSDIIVSCAGTIGETYILPKEAPIGIINQALMKVALFEYKISEFWRTFFEYILVKDSTMKGAGSAIKNIPPFEYLKKILTPLPPLKEQQRIVEKIEELIPHIEHHGKAQVELNTLNKNIKEQLKKSVLQYAIEGKLVPQDETEGTAEVLLEQIQKEKLKLYEENKLKKKDLEHSTIFKGEDNKYYEKIGKNVTEITDDMLLDLPVGWRWCRLKDIVFIFTGATFKKEEVSVESIDIRILRGGNIQPFRLTNRVDDIFLPKDKVKENILLKKNDIVTPAVTSLENIGKMARVEFDLESTTVGGFVFILRQFYCNDIVSKYLLALLSSPVLIDYIKSITNKSGQAFYNISKNRLEMTLLPLPPLAEQQRIVESIDAIFRCIEN
ncbi:restriction endonuclease subunit S [Capnocytophaga ochracea]|nr:restriction endonuclease subunit S [Capnocytophaga ochracea]